ncbi:integral membrane protein [Fusarium heterosporum]|uniref:Integral membrane protein n=1 Tax=Fusarium heterosporum TaxID=42747 RepID=A0A8H5WQ79_FUSHE|nr:integral membrane protein [Fusarium heterosporum]
MCHPFLLQATHVVSLLPAFFGINLLTRPEATLRQFEYSIPADPQARKLVRGVTRIYGSRNIVISFLFYNISLTGNTKLMSLAYLGAAAMALTDGLVVKSVVGHGQWQHWPFVPVCLAFIVGLNYA